MSVSDNDTDVLFFDNPLQIRPITQQPSQQHQSIKKSKSKKKKNNQNQNNHPNSSNINIDAVHGKHVKTPSKKVKKSKKSKKIQQNLNDSGTVINDDSQQHISCLADKLNIEEHNNDTIRWSSKRESEEDEETRLKIYKINRRKRYIEQRNKLLNLSNSGIINVNNSISSNSNNNNINNPNLITTTAATTTTNRSNTDSAISSLSSNSK
jgi:hypothetical protein